MFVVGRLQLGVHLPVHVEVLIIILFDSLKNNVGCLI